MDEYQRFFGANIRKLRKLHGLTQEQLAERSGLSEWYVSEVERGMANPRLMPLKELVQGLASPSLTYSFSTIALLPRARSKKG